MNEDIIAIFTEDGVLFDTEATYDKDFYSDNELLAELKADTYKALFSFSFVLLGVVFLCARKEEPLGQ